MLPLSLLILPSAGQYIRTIILRLVRLPQGCSMRDRYERHGKHEVGFTAAELRDLETPKSSLEAFTMFRSTTE